MKTQTLRNTLMIGALIIASNPSVSAMNLRVREGRPLVDGVYVNGHGPYRFLVDTGANINLIDANLARSIGLVATSEVELQSSAGKVPTQESDGNEIVLDSAKADRQKFLFSRLEGIRDLDSGIQGVLGQWFLSRFDYLIDLRAKKLEFGKQTPAGTRVQFHIVNARLVLPTSLGDLVLDSGGAAVVLFGADSGGSARQMNTVTGIRAVAVQAVKPLKIEGTTVWRGEAVIMPNREEKGVDGLMPLSLFKSVYVCNSEGYVILD